MSDGLDPKDGLETEHRSRRDYEPDHQSFVKTDPPSVPRLREIEAEAFARPKGSLSAPLVVLREFAVPPSVVADKVLATPTTQSVQYRVHLFAHGLRSFVPNRIAAVVPVGLTEFTRALIFFHPLPTKRAGYDDAQYADQTGKWRTIYGRYCDQGGAQLAASKRKMVFIFPIFNLASTETCGRFPAEWKSLVEDIMAMLRKSHAPGLAKEPRPTLTELVTASFSAGVKYMHTFLTRADLSGCLREVYDYDGRFSSHKDSSEKLRVSPGVKVINYDQHPVKPSEVVKEASAEKGIHLPEWRWKDLPNHFTSYLNYDLDPLARPTHGSEAVHSAVPRFMLYHSLTGGRATAP